MSMSASTTFVFVSLPYGEFVHATYRTNLLVQDSLGNRTEARSGSPDLSTDRRTCRPFSTQCRRPVLCDSVAGQGLAAANESLFLIKATPNKMTQAI